MKRKTCSRRRRRGFTLMEVLLVVAILLILASLATVAITRTLGRAQTNQAKLDINSLSQAINIYYLDNGSYPPTLDALIVMPDGLPNAQKWNGPYLEKQVLPTDPWGGQYQYSVSETDQVVIWSNGKDGAPDTADDVRNI